MVPAAPPVATLPPVALPDAPAVPAELPPDPPPVEALPDAPPLVPRPPSDFSPHAAGARNAVPRTSVHERRRCEFSAPMHRIVPARRERRCSPRRARVESHALRTQESGVAPSAFGGALREPLSG